MQKIVIEKDGKKEAISLETFEEIMQCQYLPSLAFSSFSLKEKLEEKTKKLHAKGKLTRRQLWFGSYYRKEIELSLFPDVSIRWIDASVGWGVFAERNYKKGEYIGEYSGVLRDKKREDSKNSYCFEYAISDDEITSYRIDAREKGNITRFINHSFFPNLSPMLVTFDHLTHIILVVEEMIVKGDQLLYDYGPNYWKSRKGLQKM